jgi:hypothetical protein
LRAGLNQQLSAFASFPFRAGSSRQKLVQSL